MEDLTLFLYNIKREDLSLCYKLDTSVRKGNILYFILLKRQSWADIGSNVEGPQVLQTIQSFFHNVAETHDAKFCGEGGN